MSEMPRRWSRWLSLAYVPVAVIVLLPLILLGGVALYVRALIVALWMSLMALFGRSAVAPAPPIAPPHFLDGPAELKSDYARSERPLTPN